MQLNNLIRSAFFMCYDYKSRKAFETKAIEAATKAEALLATWEISTDMILLLYAQENWGQWCQPQSIKDGAFLPDAPVKTVRAVTPKEKKEKAEAAITEYFESQFKVLNDIAVTKRASRLMMDNFLKNLEQGKVKFSEPKDLQAIINSLIKLNDQEIAMFEKFAPKDLKDDGTAKSWIENVEEADKELAKRGANKS